MAVGTEVVISGKFVLKGYVERRFFHARACDICRISIGVQIQTSLFKPGLIRQSQPRELGFLVLLH